MSTISQIASSLGDAQLVPEAENQLNDFRHLARTLGVRALPRRLWVAMHCCTIIHLLGSHCARALASSSAPRVGAPTCSSATTRRANASRRAGENPVAAARNSGSSSSSSRSSSSGSRLERMEKRKIANILGSRAGIRSKRCEFINQLRNFKFLNYRLENLEHQQLNSSTARSEAAQHSYSAGFK